MRLLGELEYLNEILNSECSLGSIQPGPRGPPGPCTGLDRLATDKLVSYDAMQDRDRLFVVCATQMFYLLAYLLTRKQH